MRKSDLIISVLSLSMVIVIKEEMLFGGAGDEELRLVIVVVFCSSYLSV